MAPFTFPMLLSVLLNFKDNQDLKNFNSKNPLSTEGNSLVTVDKEVAIMQLSSSTRKMF